VEIDRQTIVTPSSNEGEITRIAKGMDPVWKILVAAVGFIALMFSVFRTWNKIDSNEAALKELKEQVIRQYNTHKNDIETMRKDSDEELDVLEEELDKVKEKIHYHEAYEQARKELNK
jgi:flagellar biosynthesis/type III secretory pathway M-ring protein FliF/YscJ